MNMRAIILTAFFGYFTIVSNEVYCQVLQASKIEYMIRKGKIEDRDHLKALYIAVASIPGGVVRLVDEITDQYIDDVLHAALQDGVIFVAEYDHTIIGSVLKYKAPLKVLTHVLDEGTVLVHPQYQKKGIGTTLYKALLQEIEQYRPDILRVNLKVRVSNPAIRLYERLGFIKEGELKNLIIGATGQLESVVTMAWFNPNFDYENLPRIM